MRSLIVVSLLVSLCSYATAGDLQFKKHVINAKTDYSAAALIDVNHDGRLDVVCGGDWYEAPNWKKHFVAKVPRIGGRPDGFSHLEFDVNRDGWTDVITVNYRSRSIKWMEHPGKDGGEWKLRTVIEPGPMETGRLVDVDGDGQLDLLPNGRNFAAWWEFRWGKAANSDPAWIRNELPKEANGHGAGFGDIDGDGRSDIVGQNGWLKAPADARKGKWQWNPEFKIERGSVPMLVVDPDEDGDNDIVWCSAHGFGVYWLEQTQNTDGTRKWHRHAIDTSWSQGHAPLWADMDGDGRGELIAGKRYMAHGGSDPGAYDPMNVYRYQFNLTTKTWDRWTISQGDRVSMGLDPKIADIDNDGDLDLMTSGRSGLYWLENLGAGKTAPNKLVNVEHDKHDILSTTEANGNARKINNAEAWGRRRGQMIAAIAGVHGGMPTSSERVALHVSIDNSEETDEFSTRQVRYRVDKGRQVTAKLYIPDKAKPGATSGIVCMFDSGQGNEAKQIAKELATRGYVCVVPQLLAATERDSAIDGVWQAMRAADLLQATTDVHGERIGFVGDALDGRLGLFVAAIDQRFVATFTDTQRLKEASVSSADHSRLGQLIAAVAPRSLRISLPTVPNVATLMKVQANRSGAVFALRKASRKLTVIPSTAVDSETVSKWLQNELKPRVK